MVSRKTEPVSVLTSDLVDSEGKRYFCWGELPDFETDGAIRTHVIVWRGILAELDDFLASGNARESDLKKNQAIREDIALLVKRLSDVSRLHNQILDRAWDREDETD